MVLNWLWLSMVVVAVFSSILTGRAGQMGTAALDGARGAVELCVSIGGAMALWSGVMELMRRSGLAAGLSRLLRRPVGVLFPGARGDAEAREAISANITANLLGLGNAATPLGLRAAGRLHELGGGGSVAGGDVITLIVMNTASLQLIPVTLGGVRASIGAESAFDILPAVWVSSAAAMAVALVLAAVLRRRRV